MTDIKDLAEAYVMGWLEPEARDDVGAQIAAPESEEDRRLAQDVSSIQASWEDIDLTADPMSPPPEMWARIEAALDDPATEDTGPDDPKVVPMPMRDGPATRGEKPRGLRLWQSVAGLSVAASVALGALLVSQVLTPPPVVMAILLDENGNSVAVVEAFADDSVRVTPMSPIASPGAQVMQVWTKPDPDGPPVSLGILDRVIRTRLDGPDLPLPSDNQLYEITLEPQGGSPSGLPEGPILGKGLAQTTF